MGNSVSKLFVVIVVQKRDRPLSGKGNFTLDNQTNKFQRMACPRIFSIQGPDTGRERLIRTRLIRSST